MKNKLCIIKQIQQPKIIHNSLRKVNNQNIGFSNM